MSDDLPPTFEAFVEAADQKVPVVCDGCNEDVQRRWVDDGLCVGCRYSLEESVTAGVAGGEPA